MFFFDDGAKANFISPELAAKLGIRLEEMGTTCEANMANPELLTLVTPIIGKLQIHIQDFVDTKEFYIMPLPDCDVLLGISCYDHKAVIDTFGKTITISHRVKLGC